MAYFISHFRYEGKSRQNSGGSLELGAEAEPMEGCCLGDCGLLSWLSYVPQKHLPRDGSIPRGLGLSASMVNEKMTYRRHRLVCRPSDGDICPPEGGCPSQTTEVCVKTTNPQPPRQGGKSVDKAFAIQMGGPEFRSLDHRDS